MMLGSQCSPCCTQNCEAVRSDMRVVSGTALLSEVAGLSIIRSTAECLVVTTPGQWRNAANEYLQDEELPGQLRVWMSATLPEKPLPWNTIYYALPEFTHSALLWCDADGRNEAATVRLRVEHEGPDLIPRAGDFSLFSGAYTGPSENDVLFTAGLPSHSLTTSARSAGQFVAGPLKALKVYAELLDASGAVLESVRMVTPTSKLGVHILASIGLAIHAHISEGVLHCWAAIVDNSAVEYSNAGTPVFFPQLVNSWHVFNPVPLVASHQQVAFSVLGTTEPVASDAVVARYPLNAFIVPCAPESKDGLCTSTNARLRPWAAEPCTRMIKSSRVRGQRCGGTRDSLVLTIPGTATENIVRFFDAPVNFAEMLQGSYELVGYSQDGSILADGLFWYSQDDVNVSVTAGIPGFNLTNLTLTRIEISAVAHGGPRTLELAGSGVTTPNNFLAGVCTNWTAEFWYMISLLIRNDTRLPSRDAYRRYTTLFRLENIVLNVLPERFLAGEAVPLQTGTQIVAGTSVPTHVASWWWGLPQDSPFNVVTNRTTFTGVLPTIQLV